LLNTDADYEWQLVSAQNSVTRRASRADSGLRLL